jgi:hypothetical protein
MTLRRSTAAPQALGATPRGTVLAMGGGEIGPDGPVHTIDEIL